MTIEHNKLASDESELASIRECAKESIITQSLNGIVTGWNPAATRMYGYQADEIIGKPFVHVVPDERRQQEVEILERIQQGERIEDYETRRRHKAGQVVEVAVTFSPIRDGIGRVVGVLTISRDISQQKRLAQMERELLLLGAIVSSADDAVISKDLNGIVMSWNKAAERLFGYSAEEMLGRPISILIPENHPDEEPQILQRIRRGERLEHYEAKRRRKDGEIIDVSITISPIRDRIGWIIGASEIGRDITERKRWEKAEVAESFLGAIVESADDAIFSKNLDGIVTSWNSAAERLFGYGANEIIGKPVTILLPLDGPDEETRILARIRRGERIEHYETRKRHKDGRLVEVAQTISPIRDNLGRVIGASNITRDVTEQKRAVRSEHDALLQAEEAREQAEEASRAKDEFLATISHELRTPITAILGWSHMMTRGQVGSERMQQAIEAINRNARAQAQLIEDLLDISRIVSGRIRIEFKLVDLGRVIAGALESVRPAAEAKQIHIQTVLSSSVGLIYGDANRLQQVVWNLLSNSIRFTAKEGLVQIELEQVESHVELRVTDNGIGIKPEFLPHVFERFTQADRSITRTRGGLGMGLAIVKSLVELHGGVVTASSEGEGQGAIFTVKLPIRAVRIEEPQAIPAERRSVPIKNRFELVGVKILIVDDESDACELLRYVFDRTGAIVETTNNAEEALERFDMWKPDILVSDISMPGVDGFEFIRKVREERHSQTPAVALTAMARIDDRIKALSAGFQMHVSKPVEPSELVSIVANLVGLVNRSGEGQ